MEKGGPMTRERLERRLPEVGFRRIFRPSECESLETETWGEVIFVNKKALWYTVKFHAIDACETISVIPSEKYLYSKNKYSNEKYKA